MKWSQLHVLLVVFSVNAKFLIPDKEVNKNLVSAVVQIVQKIFIPGYGTLNIITAVEDRNLYFSQSFLTQILGRNDYKALFRLDNYKQLNQLKSRLRKYSVILLDSIASFRKFNEKVDAKLFMTNGYFLFVLIDGKSTEHGEIFSTLWAKYIYNVGVIYDEGEIETFMPFSEDFKCGDTSPVLLNKFVNGTFQNGSNFLFPDKFKSLHNCSVKFVTFSDTFAVSKNKFVAGSFKLSGYDVELMEALASSMKFQIHLKFLEVRDPWGIVYPNGTVTNALNEIYSRNVDVGIGNYYLRANRMSHFDSSVTYYSFPIVFVIPPGEYISSYMKLLQPLRKFVWIFLAITISIGLLVICLLNSIFRKWKDFVFGSKVKHPVLNMLIIMLGGTLHKLPGRNFSRFLLTTFSLFSLVIRSVYLGSLFIFLQSEGQLKEVESLDEMYSKGFQFFMYESEIASIQHLEKMRDKISLINSNEDNDFLDQPLQPSDKITYVVSDIDVIWSNHLSYHKFKHRTCREKLRTENLVLYFQKNFYLIQKFNEKINIFIQNGLINYWISKHMKIRDFQAQNQGPQTLSLGHLSGIFNIYLILCTISCISLLVEVCLYKLLS